MKNIVRDKAGCKILKLLGIDVSNVVEANIHIKVNNAITVDVTSFVKIDDEFVLNEDKTEIEIELKKYRLEEIKEDKNTE